MKTPKDPRHIKRQKIVKELFAESFHKQPEKDPIVKTIMSKISVIDEKIKSIAPDFPVDKINKVDLAILRLGVYEIAIKPTQPKKVVVDEAVELAKEFGGETSAGFINGALGKLIKELNETS